MTGPRPLAEALAAVADTLVPGDGGSLSVVFGRWEEIAGPKVAAHVRPLRLDGRVLVVAADHPAWATQVRALTPLLLARVGEVGGQVPERLEVVVRAP